MRKHSFDAVSFVFGVLFLLAGVPMLVSRSGLHLFEYKWVFPTFLVIAGVAVLVTSQLADRRESSDEENEPPIR
jgi:membrane protein implicated in regulation of membrane protease activity